MNSRNLSVLKKANNDIIINLKGRIKMLKYYDEIDNINIREMYLPFTNEKENFVIPNCYYINSQGLLYNCFGDDGHK